MSFLLALATMSPALSHVGDQAKSGQHLLVSSLSHFVKGFGCRPDE
jgi:hypothetical protein